MNVDFSKEELAFQQDVRTFLKDEYPDDLRKKADSGIALSREDFIR